ncbi:MAG: MarR family transcriptional regulator [Hyphomicrobiales bacterium]
MPRLADDHAEKRRLANVLATFALALSDRVGEAIRDVAGRGPQATAALIQIGFDPGLSIEALRTLIGLSHSATVRAIDGLVAEGLVRRERGLTGDSRVAALTLTKAGEAEMQKALDARAGVTGAVIDALAPGELAALNAILEKAVPAVVEFGTHQDVVCRLCDMGACPQDICPVAVCVHEDAGAPA